MANFSPEFRGAYEEDTRKKYSELAHRMHPDHGGSDESMKELNAAYEEAKKGNFLQLDKLYDSNFGSGKNPIKNQLNSPEDQKRKEELVRQDEAEKEKLYQEMQRQKDEDYQQHVKDVEANARQHEIDLEKWSKEHEQELEQAEKERAA